MALVSGEGTSAGIEITPKYLLGRRVNGTKVVLVPISNIDSKLSRINFADTVTSKAKTTVKIKLQ